MAPLGPSRRSARVARLRAAPAQPVLRPELRPRGNAPWGYHLANVAFHALAALLLFGVVRRTLAYLPGTFPAERDRTRAGFAAALLWAVHPLLTESVTYVAQRAESLMGLFYLLTLYAFVRGVQAPAGRSWLLASVLACLAGMETKQGMVTAPSSSCFTTGPSRPAGSPRRSAAGVSITRDSR